MQLGDALDLTETIRASLLSFVPRDEEGMPPVAVGVAPAERRDGYRIAVRTTSRDALPPAAHRYLRRITGKELDVRVTGPILPSSASLSIGMPAAHFRGRIGTLGCFARRNSDGHIGFVSNNHVIAAEDFGTDGDDIVRFGNEAPEQVIGRLAGDYPRLKNGSGLVDCAFARIVDDVKFEAGAIGPGELLRSTPASPTVSFNVRKVGRTTGRTEGRISAFKLTDVVVNYSIGKLVFREQIEIESTSSLAFSAPGDSGSLIFTPDGHPVGLLYAGSPIGGPGNTGLTYANPIAAVFDALNVRLVT
jgi:hypothetical protein